MGAPAFHTYVAVDWSAASRPTLGADSIWLATRSADDPFVDLRNIPTRAAAMDALGGIVTQRSGRSLVALDVPLGYPTGTARALGRVEGPGEPWRWTWDVLADLVGDDERNRNDRFEAAAALNRRIELATGVPGPFWGRPSGRRIDGLSATRPPSSPGGLATWRRCEVALRAAALRPFSVWQVAYAGSVGGQALTAIPRLHRFCRDHPATHVWPFTTAGLQPSELPSDAVVLAEVWPSAFAVDRARHPVKDAAQVLHAVDELARADADGRLTACWHPADGLDRTQRDEVLGEEGWILRPGGPVAGR